MRNQHYLQLFLISKISTLRFPRFFASFFIKNQYPAISQIILRVFFVKNQNIAISQIFFEFFLATEEITKDKKQMPINI